MAVASSSAHGVTNIRIRKYFNHLSFQVHRTQVASHQAPILWRLVLWLLLSSSCQCCWRNWHRHSCLVVDVCWWVVCFLCFSQSCLTSHTLWCVLCCVFVLCFCAETWHLSDVNSGNVSRRGIFSVWGWMCQICVSPWDRGSHWVRCELNAAWHPRRPP